MKSSNRCFLIQRWLNLTNSERRKFNVIQFEVTPFVKEQVIRDFKLQPFSFKSDETTTSQVEKQYGDYVQFWSNEMKEIVSRL